MNIEIKDNSSRDAAKPLEFPADYEYFGKDEHLDILKIFISDEALRGVDDYLASDKNNELGGVLLGDVCINSSGVKFIKIDEKIIAKHSNSSLSRLTFTHETWDYINAILEKDFPEKKILGWFHSHPGHTVFMSNYDIFIQENFFNIDYMVAYVFDPTINDRGFFYKRDDKIKKSYGYYVYDLKEKKENNELHIVDGDSDLLKIENVQKSDYTPERKYKKYLTISLLCLTLLLLLFIIYNMYDFRQKALLKEVYVKDLADLRNENRKLTERLNEYILETELKKNTQRNVSVKTSSETAAGVESTEKTAVTEQPKEEIKEKEPPPVTPQVTNQIQSTTTTTVTAKYKVKSGDTLEKISNQFYKSRAGIDLLMKHNNIKNKADIKIGQELEIPEMVN